jgi:hypothetical protein
LTAAPQTALAYYTHSYPFATYASELSATCTLATGTWTVNPVAQTYVYALTATASGTTATWTVSTTTSFMAIELVAIPYVATGIWSPVYADTTYLSELTPVIQGALGIWSQPAVTPQYLSILTSSVATSYATWTVFTSRAARGTYGQCVMNLDPSWLEARGRRKHVYTPEVPWPRRRKDLTGAVAYTRQSTADAPRKRKSLFYRLGR